jgi:two-component system sensor histidine kinase DegS
VSLELTCEPLTTRLPAETELALYRILQKALENVRKHARARHVTVRMTKQGDIVELTIKDDGIGFDPDQPPARRKERRDLGLLRMRERATYVGGALIVKSAPRAGTEILVRIPLPPRATAAKG